MATQDSASSTLRSHPRALAGGGRAGRAPGRRVCAAAVLTAMALGAGAATASAASGGAAATDGAAAARAAAGGGPRVGALTRGARGAAVAALQRRLRLKADGIFGRVTERALRRFQRRRGLRADGIVGPTTAAALGLAYAASAAPPAAAPAAPPVSDALHSAGAQTLLTRIAACESAGDPSAVSPDGVHRGKYQFTSATWANLGGVGDPAAATEAEQDMRAAWLLAREGTAPWPNCG